MAICLNTNIVFAENNTKVSIVKVDNDNYKVEITDNLASLEPTIQVNTDGFEYATVYKGNKENKNYILSKTNDSVVSFAVNEADIYYVTNEIVVTKNATYDETSKSAIDNLISNSGTIAVVIYQDSQYKTINLDTGITSFETTINATSVGTGTDDREKFDNKIESVVAPENIINVSFFNIECNINGSDVKDFGPDGKELIPLSFDLPIVLESNQMLKLFRLHNGKVEELSIDSFENGKVTFKCSHFSTFAFVIAEKETTSTSSSAKSSSYKAPKTCVE